MTLISIMTPACNAQATIARAVRSAQAQTHTDWEMIIVSDDGQDYGQILKEQGIEDARLVFASTGEVRSGPSRGRNIAMDLARGEFITTLDADDEYHPDYLYYMEQAATAYGVAMVRLSHKRKPGGETESLFGPDIKPESYCELSRLEDYLFNNGRSVTMFAKRLLKYRYTEKLSYGEDFFFDVKFFESVDVIPVFHEELYIYHFNEESLTAVKNQQADEAFIANYKMMIEILETDTVIPLHLRNSMLAMYHHRLFQNYAYVNAKAAGECVDFFDFMAKRPEYFTAV